MYNSDTSFYDSLGTPPVGPGSTQQRQLQCVITVNRLVDPNEVFNRQTEAKNSAKLFGAGTIIGASEINDKTMGIRENALLFSKADVKSMSQAYPPPVFETFNGFSTQGLRQEDFDEEFVFAGISMNQNLPGGISPNNSGVAVQVAGSRTITNNGLDTFNPGDYVAFDLPNVDPGYRETEQYSTVSSRTGEESREGRFCAVLRKADYRRDMQDIIGYVATLLLEEGTDFRVAEEKENLRKGNRVDRDFKESTAILLKDHLCTTAFHGLAVALECGLVTPTIDLTQFDPGESDQFATWTRNVLSVLSVDDYAASRKNAIVGGVATPIANPNDRVLYESKYKNTLEIFAQMFGIIYDKKRPSVQENTRLTQRILMRSLNGVAVGLKEPMLVETQKYVKHDINAVEKRLDIFGHQTASNPSAAQQRLTNVQGGIGGLSVSIGKIYQHNSRHVIGKSFSRSLPNWGLDVVL